MLNLSYSERTGNLDARIEAHSKYSKKEINDWILCLLKLKKGMYVLDIACGTGKQVVEYARAVSEAGKVVGLDISSELLDEAKKRTDNNKFFNVSYICKDANEELPFENNYFDRISFCFGIYYLKSISGVLTDIGRILKERGKALIVGPIPGNAAEIFSAHNLITGLPFPEKALVRTQRMEKEILPEMRKIFGNLKSSIFTNKVIFPSADAVLDYYKSSLLFEEAVKEGLDKDELISKMANHISGIIKKSGKFELTKKVIGLLSEKNNNFNRF